MKVRTVQLELAGMKLQKALTVKVHVLKPVHDGLVIMNLYVPSSFARK